MIETETLIPESPIDQTQFSSEEPLLQDARHSFSGKVVEVPPEKLAAQKKQKKLLLIVGGVLLFLLIILTLLAMASPRRKVLQVTASPSPSPVIQANRTALQSRVDEVNTDLQNADPSKLDLSVPPVDMTLSLDPVPRQ